MCDVGGISSSFRNLAVFLSIKMACFLSLGLIEDVFHPRSHRYYFTSLSKRSSWSPSKPHAVRCMYTRAAGAAATRRMLVPRYTSAVSSPSSLNRCSSSSSSRLSFPNPTSILPSSLSSSSSSISCDSSTLSGHHSKPPSPPLFSCQLKQSSLHSSLLQLLSYNAIHSQKRSLHSKRPSSVNTHPGVISRTSLARGLLNFLYQRYQTRSSSSFPLHRPSPHSSSERSSSLRLAENEESTNIFRQAGIFSQNKLLQVYRHSHLLSFLLGEIRSSSLPRQEGFLMLNSRRPLGFENFFPEKELTKRTPSRSSSSSSSKEDKKSSSSSSSQPRWREEEGQDQHRPAPSQNRPSSSSRGRAPNEKEKNDEPSGEKKKDLPKKKSDSSSSYDNHPFGFSNFPRRQPSGTKESQREGSTRREEGERGFPFPPPPPPPPGGLGAIQREMLKLFAWASLWSFALYAVLKPRKQELSMQEFLSKYVANGLVERLEVLGDRGECRATVYVTNPAALHPSSSSFSFFSSSSSPSSSPAASTSQQLAGSSRAGESSVEERIFRGEERSRDAYETTNRGAGDSKIGFSSSYPPQKSIVQFRSGMSAESFIEKMEAFQSSLGIHPRDYLPIYITDQHDFHILDVLGSLFLFFLLASMVSDVLFMRRIRRGGGAGGSGGSGSGGAGGSGLNRFLSQTSSKRARVKPESVKVRFADVAGLYEPKREILEFVSFLKHPQSFHKLGAKIPKGALLVGPPGTGKTLLAKAVAGEAGVPFFSISGSEFVEIFVGVGASRVRELFDEARKVSPSIIFIDEIDSVGAKRSTSFGNSERDNTLNQLLVEMDGFTPDQTVVVLAGTNRDDLLDDALKRPGRFDRIIQIKRPDVKERKEIFKVHLKPLKLSTSIDPSALAGRMAALTPGFVGADIANLCNEAAIQAARRRSKLGVEQQDFETATERTIAGLPSSMKDLLSPQQRRAIAFHECGHAIAGWFLQHGDPVLKLTIIPRSTGALGFAQQMPPNVDLHEKEGILDKIAALLGGRAAEEIFIGSISTGAADDIRKASRLARLLVMQFGMNEALGLVDYGGGGQDGSDRTFYKPYSEYTAQRIDEEVQRVIMDQYQRVKKLLHEKEKEVRLLCELLLSRESLTYLEILECIGPRPVPSNPQIAAYLEALPTRPSLAVSSPSSKSHTSNEHSHTNEKNDGEEEEEKKKDDNDNEDGERRGRGRGRDLDDNDDASLPEKVKERVREVVRQRGRREEGEGANRRVPHPATSTRDNSSSSSSLLGCLREREEKNDEESPRRGRRSDEREA